MSDIVRFTANVPYAMWPELYGVFTALDVGDTALAQQRWDASTKTPEGTYCQRAAGAIQMGYEAFKPQTAIEITPPLKASETRPVPNGQPGVLYTIQLAAGGPASVEISGSPLVTQSVGAKGVAKTEGRWNQGAGTASPIPSSPGEWLTWSYDAPQGGQEMRPQVLAA